MSENTKVKTKKPRKFKPNIIDFLVVVVIIAAIAGIVARTVLENSSSDREYTSVNFEQALVSFRVADISENSADCFKIGDEFFSVSHNCTLGVLEGSLSKNLAEVYVADQTGVLHKRSSATNRWDVEGTFICNGVFTEDGFMLQGESYLIPNSDVSVKSPSITANILITDVERVTPTVE